MVVDVFNHSDVDDEDIQSLNEQEYKKTYEYANK